MTDARAYLESLVGRELRTVTGRPNTILSVGQRAVMVAARTSEGKPVPIEWVQNAIDMLERDGEVTIDVETVGYRSAFVGAVLSTLPGAKVLPTSPPRIALGN
jgi:hypothetical protein